MRKFIYLAEYTLCREQLNLNDCKSYKNDIYWVFSSSLQKLIEVVTERYAHQQFFAHPLSRKITIMFSM